MKTRVFLAELIATAFLCAAVIGSGIMAERLANGNLALALLANSAATGAALIVLIVGFAPISGAHMNPIVSLALMLQRRVALGLLPLYLSAQVIGAWIGLLVAHAMFELPLWTASMHQRSGTGLWLAECVASFGLLITIFSVERARAAWVPLAVASYIVAAYWFTSSTSFANPALTFARGYSDTFAGIAPSGIVAFVAAQLMGMLLALAAWRVLHPRESRT